MGQIPPFCVQLTLVRIAPSAVSVGRQRNLLPGKATRGLAGVTAPNLQLAKVRTRLLCLELLVHTHELLPFSSTFRTLPPRVVRLTLTTLPGAAAEEPRLASAAAQQRRQHQAGRGAGDGERDSS